MKRNVHLAQCELGIIGVDDVRRLTSPGDERALLT